MPGFSSNASHSHSISHKAFGPIWLSIIQSGSYFAERGNSGLISRLGRSFMILGS